MPSLPSVNILPLRAPQAAIDTRIEYKIAPESPKMLVPYSFQPFSRDLSARFGRGQESDIQTYHYKSYLLSDNVHGQDSIHSTIQQCEANRDGRHCNHDSAR